MYDGKSLGGYLESVARLSSRSFGADSAAHSEGDAVRRDGMKHLRWPSRSKRFWRKLLSGSLLTHLRRLPFLRPDRRPPLARSRRDGCTASGAHPAFVARWCGAGCCRRTGPGALQRLNGPRKPIPLGSEEGDDLLNVHEASVTF